MNLAYLNSPELSFYSCAQEQLEHMIAYLDSPTGDDCEHGEIEKYINEQGYELLRRLLQGYLDSKAAKEECLPNVQSITGVQLNHIRSNFSKKNRRTPR